LLNSAVTIHAVNLNGIARLAVEFPIAVAILFEVAVDTMHSLLKMNVVQVDGFLKLVGIVRRYHLFSAVQVKARMLQLVNDRVNQTIIHPSKERIVSHQILG